MRLNQPNPEFLIPIERKIEHFPSHELCVFFSVDQSFVPTAEDITRIAEVCSQKLIYERLFKERFKGEPYTEEKANEFINWAKDGWQKGEWFVFLVRNPHGQVSCCVDIKSNNLNGAEIGYWASQDSPGLATNATIALCQVAEKAGYKSLFALVLPDNTKSLGVAKRAGFAEKERVVEKNKEYSKLSKDLRKTG